MPLVKVDKKGRITLPKRLKAQFNIRPGQALVLRPRRSSLVIEKLDPRSPQGAKADPLFWLLEHPAHVGRKKFKSVDLRRVEREMWLP